MNTMTITTNAITVKSTLVINVNGNGKGTVDLEASIANFKRRVTEWEVESAKAEADEQNERRIAELTNQEKIAETSAKVLSLYGNRYAPRDLYMSQVLCSLTTFDGATALHPELYQPVRMAVEAWLKGQKEAGKILISKGKSGGVKAAAPNVAADIAQAAE